ncbi:MAG: hypothetical protein N2422_00580 [Rhodobacteraceae bacterium]|nr:hypothetical protein [Paracoccaceae bacterium]
MNWNRPLFSPRVLRLHAENAAFLARLVELSRDGPMTRMVDLYDMEARLDGHLDALVLAGQAGAEAAGEVLAAAQGWGEVFTAAHVLLRHRAEVELADLLPEGVLVAENAGAIAAGAAACPPERIAARMRRWIGAADPLQAAVALGVCLRRGTDARDHLLPLTRHRDEGVAALALRLAGETGRSDLLAAAQARIGAEDAPGFEAARAATLLGDRGAGPRTLAAAAALLPPRQAREAAELFPLVLPEGEVRRAIGALHERPASRRWAVVAAGAFGRSDSFDWLLRQMAEPSLARAAGLALCQITGIRLGAENLELATFPEDPPDPVVEADPLESFIEGQAYWPDPEKLAPWLEARRGRFAAGERHLAGAAAWTHQPPAEDRDRTQLVQRALALEFACRSPEAPLPNWRAPVRPTDRGFTRT